MDFSQLIDRFWRLHDEKNFTPKQTHLYFGLLHIFLENNWPGELCRPDASVQSFLAMYSRESFVSSRRTLKERGLINFAGGYNPKDKTNYCLCDGKSPCRASSPEGESQVYLLFSGELNLFKIGTSTDPYVRVRQINSVAHLYSCSLVCHYPGGYAEERELHRLFSSKRAFGEWFKLNSPEDVNQFKAFFQ